MQNLNFLFLMALLVGCVFATEHKAFRHGLNVQKMVPDRDDPPIFGQNIRLGEDTWVYGSSGWTRRMKKPKDEPTAAGDDSISGDDENDPAALSSKRTHMKRALVPVPRTRRKKTAVERRIVGTCRFLPSAVKESGSKIPPIGIGPVSKGKCCDPNPNVKVPNTNAKVPLGVPLAVTGTMVENEQGFGGEKWCTDKKDQASCEYCVIYTASDLAETAEMVEDQEFPKSEPAEMVEEQPAEMVEDQEFPKV